MSWYSKAWKYGKWAVPVVAAADYAVGKTFGNDYTVQGLLDNQTNDPAAAEKQRLQDALKNGSPYSQAPQLDPALISQLRDRSEGRGPSAADQAYRQASQDSLSQQAALAHGGSAMQARQALLNQGHIQQGLTAGVTQARTAEQSQALGQYQQALAINAQLQQGSNLANQNAYLDILNKQLALDSQPKPLSPREKALHAAVTVGATYMGGPVAGAAANQLAGGGYQNNYGDGTSLARQLTRGGFGQGDYDIDPNQAQMQPYINPFRATPPKY